MSMFFHIDPTDGVPIYDQVVRQVKYAVAAGALKAGDRVSSVRELAGELAINPNTVARAYRELQADGVLVTVQGIGLEVAAGAVRWCRKARVELIQDRLRQVLREARSSGLDPEALEALWQDALQEMVKTEEQS
jgi:GntR family transcriptional regulator